MKKSSPSSAMKPASRKPSVISFQSICQSPRKLCATSDQAAAESSRSRRAQLRARGVVLVPAVGLLRVRARLAPPAARETNSAQQQRTSARSSRSRRGTRPSVNCQPIRTHRTRPSSHTRFVEANWNASADAAEAPFWNRLLRDRDRRVGARGGCGAEPGRERDRPEAAARERALDPLGGAPTPARSRRSRTRARAPTRPPRPSGTRSRAHPRSSRGPRPSD